MATVTVCGALLATRGFDGNLRYCECHAKHVRFSDGTACCGRHTYSNPVRVICECSICLSDCLNTDSRTTSCKHQFHKKCIAKWLNTHTTCPLCRTSIGKKNVTPPQTNEFDTLMNFRDHLIIQLRTILDDTTSIELRESAEALINSM